MAPANGVAVREGRVFFAGSAGVFELDQRVPGTPGGRTQITTQVINNPVDLIISGTIPGQTWVLVLEGNGNLVGVKLDNTKSPRERCFPNPRMQCGPLDMQLLDPTIMGRDPSFDPNTNAFDAGDPSGLAFFRISAGTGVGKRLARPSNWEQIGTLTGRRLRDSFMPGAGVLSLDVMQRMHNYQVCEIPGEPSTNPSGLDGLGEFQGGQCVPFDGVENSARKLPKNAAIVGKPAVVRARAL
jgi:hypothetical protein